MAGTPSPGFGHLKIPLPHDPTDRPYDACLRPSSCAGAVPARDRLRIVLQYSGERTYNALALRLGLKRSENLYRIRKGYNGISMDLALRIRNICPSLSLSWLLGGEGDPEIPDQTSAEAASAEVLYLPFYPDLLSLDRDFRPGEDRRIPFPSWLCREAEAAVSCSSDALSPRLLPGRLHASRPGRRPSPSCSAELMSSLSGRPGCAGLSARTSRRSASGSFR